MSEWLLESMKSMTVVELQTLPLLAGLGSTVLASVVFISLLVECVSEWPSE